MFTEKLFTIAGTRKQPKRPSTDERVKKMWYVYTMEYYLTINRNEIGSIAVIWMTLEPVIQSQVRKRSIYMEYIWKIYIYGIYMLYGI